MQIKQNSKPKMQKPLVEFGNHNLQINRTKENTESRARNKGASCRASPRKRKRHFSKKCDLEVAWTDKRKREEKTELSLRNNDQGLIRNALWVVAGKHKKTQVDTKKTPQVLNRDRKLPKNPCENAQRKRAKKENNYTQVADEELRSHEKHDFQHESTRELSRQMRITGRQESVQNFPRSNTMLQW